MGKLNTILEKIINTSNMSISQIIEKAASHAHHDNHNLTAELDVNDDYDIHEMVERCRDEIQAFEDEGVMPSPKFFEQVAILSRKEKNYENEVAICELYIELINQYAAKNQITDAEMTVQLLPKCAPFVKRVHNAKIMSVKH